MKNKVCLFLFCLALVWTGCKKDNQENEELEENIEQPTDPNATVEDLNVPDGFQYSVSTKVDLTMVYTDNTNNPASTVFYTILGGMQDGSSEELYNGSSGVSSEVKTKVNIPNHFDHLIIRTNWDDHTKYFEYPIEQTIRAELVVNGFTSNSGDTRSNNCYPTVNTTFNNENTGFSISSDQTITTIEIIYSDGTTEIVPVNGTSFSY